jgi:hypothetical protein
MSIRGGLDERNGGEGQMKEFLRGGTSIEDARNEGRKEGRTRERRKSEKEGDQNSVRICAVSVCARACV